MVRSTARMVVTGTLAALLAAPVMTDCALAQDMPSDFQDALSTLHCRGEVEANVLRIEVVRGDAHVNVGGVPVPPEFAAAGWIALAHSGGGADVLMADLPVRESDLGPALSALTQGGVDVMAVQTAFAGDSPRMYRLKVRGVGPAASMAAALKPALDIARGPVSTGDAATAGVALSGAALASVAAAPDFDINQLDRLMGTQGENRGGVRRYTIARADLKVKWSGAALSEKLGLCSAAAFYGSDDDAVAAGEIAATPSEAPGAIQALRSRSLEVIAVTPQLVDTKTPLVSIRFCGRGRARTLADGVRAALLALGSGPR